MFKDVIFVIGILAVLLYANSVLAENGAMHISTEGFVGARSCAAKAAVFMSAAETSRFLKSDPDTYVRTMTPWDLYARKMKNIEDYLTRASAAATDFEPAQKERFSKATADADAFFRKQGSESIANIPWVFAMTQGDAYEDGMPHTRTNVIFVSSMLDETHERLVQTLVHEKLHVYQRANPEKMAIMLQTAGYTRWKYRVGEPRIRSNPDVDPWIYIDPKTNKPMACYYSSDKPSNISDITSNPESEHPFERMAYEIAKKIYS